MQKVLAVDPDIGEISAALRRDAGPHKTALDGCYAGAGFAEVAGEGAAAAPEFENAIPRLDAERTQQAVARATQVILARPIRDRLPQLGRKRVDAAGGADDLQQPPLRFLAVGIGEPREAGAAPYPAVAVRHVGGGH